MHLKQQKNQLKEQTMKKISGLGLKVPPQWKDELRKNKIEKADIKKDLF